MKSFVAALTLMCGLLAVSEAFVAPSCATSAASTTRRFESATEETEEDNPPANPAFPNLPEVKGDFDWDAKFGGDDDWITENVPGKIVLDEITLARQVTGLNQLEDSYRAMRRDEAIEDYQTVGWVGNAETLNGRFAMFFLVVGLLTEQFTGVSMPGQVEELLRILGFIGFD